MKIIPTYNLWWWCHLVLCSIIWHDYDFSSAAIWQWNSVKWGKITRKCNVDFFNILLSFRDMESWTLLISKEKTRRLRIFSNSSHTIQTEEDLWWEVHLSGFCVFSGTSINLLCVSPILLLRNGVVRQSYVDHYLRSEISQFFFPSTLSHSVALWGANLVTMGAGNFVYSTFGHFVDLVFDWSQKKWVGCSVMTKSCFRSFRFNDREIWLGSIAILPSDC